MSEVKAEQTAACAQQGRQQLGTEVRCEAYHPALEAFVYIARPRARRPFATSVTPMAHPDTDSNTKKLGKNSISAGLLGKYLCFDTERQLGLNREHLKHVKCNHQVCKVYITSWSGGA